MNKGKLKAIIGVAGAVCILVLFGLALHWIDNAKEDNIGYDNELQDVAEDPVLYFGDYEYTIRDDVESYLLIGTDDGGNEEAVGTKEYRGAMADFLLLFVMNNTKETYGFLQINRDTIVDVPYMDTEGNGSDELKQQICTAHWYGGSPEQGCENTVFAVSELLGFAPITGYYSIHMSKVDFLNHAVGGVEVTIDEDMTATDPAFVKGKTIKLTDKQAQEFVRARMEVGSGENTARMDRQMQYMSAFKAKAQAKLDEDPAFVNDIYDELQDNAVTDIPSSSISSIVHHLTKSKDLGILQIAGEKKIGKTLGDGKDYTEFYADEESIAEAMVKLYGISENDIKYIGGDE